MFGMRKTLITAVAALIIMLCGMSYANAEGVLLEYDGGTHEYNGEFYSLFVNNQLIDPPLAPIIFNDRALVPVREIFEEVGAEVNYINETQTVEVKGANTDVTLRINDNVAYVNGSKTRIPDNVVPKLISKVGGETKTMVPVRFISESIGLDVEFDGEDGAILIESGGYTLADESQLPQVSEPEPESEPEIFVTDITYDIISSISACVTVTTDGAIDNYNDFVLQSPQRIVVDIQNGKLATTKENTIVGAAGLNTIRAGDNGERARIVLDINGLKTYTVNQTSDNTIEIRTVISAPKQEVAAEDIKNEITATVTQNPQYTAHSSDDMLIVLDAGHGGTDSGATGELNGEPLYEKNLTLQITKRVQAILENAGYHTSLTREGDTLPSLAERPEQANAENAALFISIHINSANVSEAHGTEVFYATENNGDAYGVTSETFAENVLSRMLKYMQSVNRGVKTAEHAVTRRCNMPAVLAEVGFISNPDEAYLMTTDEYQQKVAQGIAEGVILTLREVTIPEQV